MHFDVLYLFLYSIYKYKKLIKLKIDQQTNLLGWSILINDKCDYQSRTFVHADIRFSKFYMQNQIGQHRKRGKTLSTNLSRVFGDNFIFVLKNKT